MLQLLADVTQESLCVWALQQPLGRFRAKGRRNKYEIDSPFFFGSQFLMESFDLLDPWISTLAHVCSTWPLILHLSPCTPWQFSPLMVAYFRPFEPTDAAESAIADGRRWLQSCASGQAEGSDGIYRLARLARLAFVFFSTARFKSVVLLHIRKPERKWKIQSMRFSRLVGLQIFAYSSVLRCSSAD